MKYFLHDTSAFQDEKVSELFQKFGYEGLGLFYTVLEKLAFQEKPIKTTVLKAQLKVGKRLEKCWSFMESLGIISSTNEETFSERMLSYTESFKKNQEKTRKKVSEWREKQEDTNSVTGYVPKCNPPNIKESKVKESKDIGIRPTPDFAIELSSINIGAAIEYLKLTKQQDASPELIQSLWTVFKQKHFTGAKFYNNPGEIISHFFESLKFVKLELNGNKSGAKYNPREAGANQLLQKAKLLFVASRGAANTGS